MKVTKHDELLAIRRTLNARKAAGENVRDEMRDNERNIRDSRAAGNNASPARATPKAEPTKSTKRAKAPKPAPKAEPTKRERLAPERTYPEPNSEPRKRLPIPVTTTVHTDVDIDEPMPAADAPVADTRPKAVVDAEAAWRASKGPDGRAAFGSAYTLLQFAKFEVARLEAELNKQRTRIEELKLQVSDDPSAHAKLGTI